MKLPPLLLIVDDEPIVFPLIEHAARKLGFEVETRSDPAKALAELPTLRPDVMLVDLQMPGVGGLQLLEAISEAHSECQSILMTGAPSIETAIEAIKLGAIDYLAKPLDFDRLRGLLTTISEDRYRRERLLQADADVVEQVEFQHMIGRTPSMQQLFATVRRFAPHARTLLVTGETGTGKELVARALHNLGPRRARRFVTVNCSAVVETLFESELFGHMRGAFTGATDNKVGLFEHASGGTLFMDEVGELPQALQPKLLRAVEYGEVQRVGSLERRSADVNVIAATNRDLRTESAAGRFRMDLYYRLSTLEIHLPPLRERREDIPYLAAHFIREFATRAKRPIAGMTAGAERLLREAPWPGNIRELRNVLERACILAEAGLLTERDLSYALAPQGPAAPVESGGTDDRLSTIQHAQIVRVLSESGGNKSEAARRLGISRRSLYRRLGDSDPEDAPAR